MKGLPVVSSKSDQWVKQFEDVVIDYALLDDHNVIKDGDEFKYHDDDEFWPVEASDIGETKSHCGYYLVRRPIIEKRERKP